MKNKKTTSLFIVVSFLFLLVGSFVLSSCESSRVGPELPQPNPPAPPAQPLVLQGTVVDDQTHVGVAGASVGIAKINGTVVATLTTDGNGIYSTDLSAQTDTIFIVGATATGYGSSSVYASVNKRTNSAGVSPVSITKIQGSTFTAAPATGTTANTPPTTESATNNPVSITVPQNAVTTSTQITISAVSCDNVPPYSNANLQVLLVVANVAPAGLTFNQPVTITYPLPLSKAAAAQLSAVKLNATTGLWESITAKGTVDATGTLASLPVTSSGTYALIDDNVTIDVSAITLGKSSTFVLNKLSNVLDEQYVALRSGSTTLTLTYNNTFVHVSSTGGAPTDAWIINQLSRILHMTFGNFIQTFRVNFPGLPTKYINNGVQYNPDRPNESGLWEFRWYYSSFLLSQPGSVSRSIAPTFTVTFRLDRTLWALNTKTGWYWIPHNQGGISFGPF